GAWGHRTGLNLAYAFVEPELARQGAELALDLLGDLVPAKVIPPGPFDPEMRRVRA
ncbi:MAG: glycine cleavage T C-terminal barrel domain-containing protein, partial [Pseudomonadota bacterium]